MALATPNHDLPLFEIKIFRARLETPLQPESCAVQQSHDDPRDAIEVLHDPRDLVAAQDDRHANRHSRARHVLSGADFDVQRTLRA